MSFLIGLVIGSIIALVIPNPFIWLDDKLSERRSNKRTKALYEEYKSKGFNEDTCRYISGYRD